MSDRGEKEAQQQNSADDVATLYSWANLHGAKYRDFSASRQELRAQARHRVAQSEIASSEVVEETLEAAPVAEAIPSAAVESKVAAPKAAFREAVVDYVRMPAVKAASEAAELEAWKQESSAPLAEAVDPVEPSTISPAAAVVPASPVVPGQVRADSAPAEDKPLTAAAVDKPAASSPAASLPTASGPAAPLALGVPHPAQRTNRQQAGSRWFALQGFLDRKAEERPAEARERRTPTLAVFSLAGGVGKTSLVANLGRALSAAGEQVLLADISSYGMLPFYFGSREVRPGLVRTFSPSDGVADAEVHLVTVDADKHSEHDEGWIAEELKRDARGSSRILVDLMTASRALANGVLALAPTVLVPVVPDMNSVASLGIVEELFGKHHDTAGRPIKPFYVLSKFESSLPLHLDLREMLRAELGERLLPFVIRRSPDMGEALAEGMTVMDYAPESPVADDYRNLAAWMRSVSAPASLGFRGVRWSER